MYSPRGPTSDAAPDLPELRDVHEQAKLSAYIRGVWGRRDYVFYVARQELQRRQINSVLGNLWHLLNPALTIGVYFLIFGVLLDVKRGTDNFLLFLTVGVFVFRFTQLSTLAGARSIVQKGALMRGIRFPRAILPISATVTEFLAALPTFLIMLIAVMIGGIEPRVEWLVFPVLIVVQLLFNAGAAMVAARATVHFRDTIQFLPFLFRLLLYGSGVLYSVDRFVVDQPGLQALFTANPMYCFLTIARASILGEPMNGAVVASATIWTIVMFFGGFAWFRAGEDRYGRE